MIRIERNMDGTPQTNHTSHTANLTCDICGTVALGVDMNSVAAYLKNLAGTNIGISLSCTSLGGPCDSVTCWPLVNGTGDAAELAVVKTA